MISATLVNTQTHRKTDRRTDTFRPVILLAQPAELKTNEIIQTKTEKLTSKSNPKTENAQSESGVEVSILWWETGALLT